MARQRKVETISPLDSASRRPLALSQLELLGDDIDHDEIRLALNNKIGIEIGEAITDGSVSRTIEGASTLTLTVNDYDRILLRSGQLSEKLDINLSGLWWRFKEVDKNGDELTLTFEEREIAVMRTYATVIPPVSRSQVTRFEFIMRMIREMDNEIKIPVYIPDLHTHLPIQADPNANLNLPQDSSAVVQQATSDMQRDKGVASDMQLTVKGQAASIDQYNNANTVLKVGDQAIPNVTARKRKMLVCSIMTAIQESSISNLPDEVSDADSHGVFQQRPSQGWNNSTDVAVQASEFFAAIIKADAANPNAPYTVLCQLVQHSRFPDAYAQWRTEAETWVSAYGIPGGDEVGDAKSYNNQAPSDNFATGDYHYYRGVLPSTGQSHMLRENTWDCIQRLVQEVGYRAFVVSGRLYIFSDDELMKSKPRATLSEDTPGIEAIDGNYDRNKKVASVDVTLRMGLFDCPPGAVVVLKDMGPFNGRWLVSTVERNLYDMHGTMNLKKPDPILPEPATDSIQQSQAFTGPINNASNSSVIVSQGTTSLVTGDIAALAEKILKYADQGSYRDDNGQQLSQWRKLADGKMLHSQCGTDVFLNPKVAQYLLQMLDSGWMVGTFALVEDHHCNDGQHPIGEAVDISSIGKVGIGWRSLNVADIQAKEWVKYWMLQFRNNNPKQIICNGVGFIDPEVQAIQWNNGSQVSYITTDHINHMHVGV